MQHRAIETRYKGYRFRSRLEARWAVFFDALGLKWEYEPEGFELPGGVRYLPDFRVAGTDTNGDAFLFWFEVKPPGESSGKARALAKQMAAQELPGVYDVILLDGPPTLGRTYSGLVWHGPDEVELDWWLWSQRRRPWHNDMGNWDSTFFYGCRGEFRREQAAVDAARGARFEHGESGAAR